MMKKILTLFGAFLICFGFIAMCCEAEKSVMPQLIGVITLISGFILFGLFTEETQAEPKRETKTNHSAHYTKESRPMKKYGYKVTDGNFISQITITATSLEEAEKIFDEHYAVFCRKVATLGQIA